MEFNGHVFKGAVISKGFSLQDIADCLGINCSTLYRKIARNGDFSRAEIRKIADKLSLNEAERDAIFFGL